MARRLRILVAGGYDPLEPGQLERDLTEVVAFTSQLGGEIMAQGHRLLTGCRTDLDRVVAEGAQGWLRSNAGAAERVKERIVSYVNQGTSPAHNVGTVLQSELVDWELGGEDLNPPEIVRDADAVILIGGFRGTFRAANWARIQRKPLLPLALFGGAAKKICLQEAKRVELLYPGNVSRGEYEAVLKALDTDWARRAREVVELAERLATSRDVFIVMSFGVTPQFEDLLETIQEACRSHGYEARRVDESNDGARVIPEILRCLRQCAFVVADVTEAKPNVYWELGVASGLAKEVIVVARKGTELPFDISDVPTIFWDGFKDFKQKLGKRVEKIAERQGRAQLAE